MSRHDGGTPRPHEMLRVSLEEVKDKDGNLEFKIALADGLEPRVPGHHDPKLWQKGTGSVSIPRSAEVVATIEVHKLPTEKDHPGKVDKDTGPHAHYYFTIGNTTWEVHC